MRLPLFALLAGTALAIGCEGSISESSLSDIRPPRVPADPLFDSDECEGEAPDTEASRWRRLTQRQYQNAIRDVFGVEASVDAFLPDAKPGDSPFSANVGINIQAQDVDTYWTLAEQIARDADVAAYVDCDLSEGSCVETFIRTLGRRAYRRPLAESEVVALQDLFALGADEGPLEGARMVVTAMAQSPHLLYVEEYGYEGDANDSAEENAQIYELNGFEVTTRLSLLLWNTVPDDDLLDAAAAGELDDAEGIGRMSERMMEDARFVDTLVDFHVGLALDHPLDEVSRAEEEFTPELRAAMRAELEAYIRAVMENEGSVQAFFTSQVERGEDLELIYGDDPGVRRGVMTLPAVLASSPEIETFFVPTYRGNSIRERMLCDPPPPPEIAIEFDGTPQVSPREQLRAHQDNPGCASCHAKMDPLGFPLENYDDLGRWRSEAFGEAIDASGQILLSRPEGLEEVVVSGPDDLGDALGQLDEVRACFAIQWFRFAFARTPGTRDGCSLRPTLDTLLEGGGDIRAAVLTITTSDAFRLRRGD